jgi:hypothetical protein
LNNKNPDEEETARAKERINETLAKLRRGSIGIEKR